MAGQRMKDYADGVKQLVCHCALCNTSQANVWRIALRALQGHWTAGSEGCSECARNPMHVQNQKSHNRQTDMHCLSRASGECHELQSVSLVLQWQWHSSCQADGSSSNQPENASTRTRCILPCHSNMSAAVNIQGRSGTLCRCMGSLDWWDLRALHGAQWERALSILAYIVGQYIVSFALGCVATRPGWPWCSWVTK